MKYQRKTRDVFSVEGYYSMGWETVCSYDTRSDARQGMEEYWDNEKGTMFRIVMSREKIT